MKPGTLTSWNPLGHSRPLTGLLYFFFTLRCTVSKIWNKLLNQFRLQRKSKRYDHNNHCFVKLRMLISFVWRPVDFRKFSLLFFKLVLIDSFYKPNYVAPILVKKQCKIIKSKVSFIYLIIFFGTARLISQSLQLKARVTLASLGYCHKSWKYATSCVRISLWFFAVRAVEMPIFICLRSICNHVAGVWKAVKLVRLEMKFVMQDDGNFVDIILLY